MNSNVYILGFTRWFWGLYLGLVPGFLCFGIMIFVKMILVWVWSDNPY